MNITKEQFFEEIAQALDYWTEHSANALTDADSDLSWTECPDLFRLVQQGMASSEVKKESIRHAVGECLRGLIVSVLTVADGGTALADKGRLYLVDDRGNRLGEGLHDGFVEHLFDSGRLS